MSATEVRTGQAPGDGVQIAYEDMGTVGDPTVVLIMGFAAQLTLWPPEFCDALVDSGYRVVRLDNRDIGLSTTFDGTRVGGQPLLRMAKYWFGQSSSVPYTLVDMAGDVRAVLDHLDIDTAHIVGASMGGMIAQVFAAEHAARVRTLSIIFSSTNQPFLPPPTPAALRSIISGPGKDATREQIIASTVRSFQVIGSPAYPESVEITEKRVAADYDRSYNPAGMIRQFAAVTGTGSLLRFDKRIDVPTVVIHGSADPLVRPACGKAVAKAIRGARLHVIDGMGHNLPPQLLPQITGLLKDNFGRAEA